MILFGSGTGRCGSKTVAWLINNQPNCNIRHEMRHILPYQIDEEKFLSKSKRIIRKYGNYRLFGDCAHYYLYYVDLIFKYYPNAKIFFLKRNKKQVVRSYYYKVTKRKVGEKYTAYRNFWQNTRGRYPCDWDQAYPTYDRSLSLEEAISRYYDDYYLLVEKYLNKYPEKVQLFDIDILNDRKEMNLFFDYIEIPNNSRKYFTGVVIRNRWLEVKGKTYQEIIDEKNSSVN